MLYKNTYNMRIRKLVSESCFRCSGSCREWARCLRTFGNKWSRLSYEPNVSPNYQCSIT